MAVQRRRHQHRVALDLALAALPLAPAFHGQVLAGAEPSCFAAVALVAGYPSCKTDDQQSFEANALACCSGLVTWVHSKADSECPYESYGKFFQTLALRKVTVIWHENDDHQTLYKKVILDITVSMSGVSRRKSGVSWR